MCEFLRTDTAAAPVVLTARHNADVLLPRRRHLRREQFRCFPNRFFDTEMDIEAGRTWKGTAYLAELLAPTGIGTILAARSATAGLCTVDGRISDSDLHLALTPLSEPRTKAIDLSAPLRPRPASARCPAPPGRPRSATAGHRAGRRIRRARP